MKANEQRNLLQYDLMLVLVTFIWGTTFVIAKSLLESLEPLNYLSARFLVAAVFFAAISPQVWRSIDRNAIAGGAVLGGLLYLGFITQAVGLSYTTPSKSAFVSSTAVIFIPFLSRLLIGYRIRAEHLIAVTLAAFGVGLLTLPESNEGINKGDLITLAGTLFWALHVIYTSVWSKRVGTRSLMMIQLIVSAILFWASLILLNTIGALPTVAGKSFPAGMTAYAQLAYLAVIATIGVIFFQTRAQRYTSPTRAAIIFSLEPAFASIVSYLAIGEHLGWRAIAGGVLIISAIIVSSVKFFQSANELETAKD